MCAADAVLVQAKVVSQYRKQIKGLRDQLMIEVAGVAGSFDQGDMTGTDISHVIANAEKARLAMAGLEAGGRPVGPQPGAVRLSEEERLEIARLEEENHALRQRANATLMRMQYLEDLKKQQQQEQQHEQQQQYETGTNGVV
jgi:hypothetical protein